MVLSNISESRLLSTIAFLLFIHWRGTQRVDALILRQEVEIAVPSIDTTKFRDFLLWFPDIDSTLDMQDMQTFTKTTQEYLYRDGDLTFETFKILGQAIDSIDKLPLSKSILFQSGGESILDDYLAKTMGLTIHVLATGGETDSIVAFLSNNWEQLVDNLHSGGLKQFASPHSAVVSRTTDPNAKKQGFTWTLVALVVSIVALAVVVLARRTGRRRQLASLKAMMDGTSRVQINGGMQSGDRFSLS